MTERGRKLPDASTDERTARELRLAGIRAAMDQVMAERLAAEAKYRRLTAELIGIGAEARADQAREQDPITERTTA